jgi:hypothetical protein
VDGHLASLMAELTAIELWDDIHFRKKVRDASDEISYRARRERWHQITREILTIFDPRSADQQRRLTSALKPRPPVHPSTRNQ